MSTTPWQTLNEAGGSPARRHGKILACKRCQYKKLKCSRTVPCDACQKARVECEYREVDRKRRPASQDHVTVLQNRVTWLEEFILDLQGSSPSERDSKLRAVNFISNSPRGPLSTTAETQFGSVLHRTTNLHVTSDGSMSFHGPTSICQVVFDDDESLRPSGSNEIISTTNEAFQNVDHVLRHFDIDIDANIITQTLVLFFKWQYPNFMFVYRDTFLKDHYGVRQRTKYWSVSLLLAVCAIGSLMLPENERGTFGDQCHDAAESIAMVTDLTKPSITGVQTFLCLAFYEIGLGNLSKGWAFSGIAFRMAQDLGFQKDPETWSALDQSLNTNEDVEVRRRIYWGCYISDKLISLVFGRPVQLLYDEAEVHELETQYDPPFILPWRSVGFDDDASQQYTDISMIPYIKEQICLSRVLERMLSLISSDSNLKITFQQQNVDSLNHDLLEWRLRLSEWADFSMWDIIDKPLKPSIAAIHLLYNSARIALNFNVTMSLERNNFVDQAREACLLAATEIHSILRRFRNQHGLRNSPPIIVYALAQAVRVSKAFGTREETNNLLEGMTEIATTWPLASRVMSGRV